ncbi:hypothetical protein DX910_00680 [Acinetobacter haemolyticus]|nr:hypothetical protein DX910_00680 [Acinetobacter haemolyticus]
MFDIEKEREAFEKALEQSQGFEFKYLIGITFNNDLNKYEASGAHWCDEVIEACKEINIGWTSWQLAKAHEAKKLEGCVVVPVELSESIAEKLALGKVEKPRQENDVVWQEIADHAYRDRLLQKKWEIIRDYKELVEAARGGK